MIAAPVAALAAAQEPTTSPGGAPPELVVPSSEADLGNVAPDAKSVVRLLPLRNAGSGALEIRTVRASCACLRASVAAARVPPGAETHVRLELDPLGRDGPITEQVLIYSNDPAKPLVKLSVRAFRRLPIEWSPTALAIGWVHRGPELPGLRFRSIRLAPRAGAPLGPLRIVPSSPHLRVETTPEPGGAYRLRVRLDPLVPLGPFQHTLRVETANAEMPVIEVPVRGGILGDVYAAVHRVDFGLVEEGRPAAATFLVKNAGAREVTVLRAEPHLPLRVEVKLRPRGRDTEVTVNLPDPPPMQSLDGRLDLYTDHPEHPLFSVPVRGWVWARRPFDLAGAEGATQLLALVRAALAKGHTLSPEEFIARILGGVRDDRAVSVLLRALAEGDWPRRARAVEVLGILGQAGAIETLRRTVTDDPDEDVRRSAVTALARVAGARAVPDLLLALEDDDAWVRQEAAAALGQLGDARALGPLRAALSDPDEGVRGAARHALERLERTAR